MRAIKRIKKRLQYLRIGPQVEFHSQHHCLRNNARRLEHLNSLGIDVRGSRVLEVGAGIGDHTHYYIDRDCKVVATEVRKENIDFIKKRYAHEKQPVDVRFLNMGTPSGDFGIFDVVHCYGLLYHLANPQVALDFMGELCRGSLFLETVVSFEDDLEVNPVSENQFCPSQAFSGRGCRPSRRWVVETLKRKFSHVYIPTTQPNHEEFPLDWDDPSRHASPLVRSIFVASQRPLDNPLLDESIPRKQTRHS